MMNQETRTLTATDEGTHGSPKSFRLYRLPTSRYQLCVYFGGGLIRNEEMTEKPTNDELQQITKGRVRWFKGVPA
jgi:hypothetical protein